MTRRLWLTLLPLLAALLGLVLLALPATIEAKIGVAQPAGAGSGGAVAEPSIIGGGETTIARRPWQVAVFEQGKPICGGSLLAPTVVVTAAHCVFNEVGQVKRARYFDVVTGRTRLSSSQGQELGVRKIHTFKDSRGRELYELPFTWDVVLLELSAPSNSATIKIAGQDERDLWTGGRDAYISGWGWTKKKPPRKPGKGYPDVLRGAKVQINSDARCRSVYAIYDKALMVCAGGGAPERDGCYGDSGGPLVVPMAAGGYRLVGDTSFGGPRCGPGGVYGRLAAEPIRGMVQAKVLALTGIDVVGSGAAPVPPTMALNPMTRGLAELRAFRFVFEACGADRRCADFAFDRCKRRGASFACKVRKFIFPLRRSAKRATLIRKLRVREAKPGGAIRAKKLGRWKKRRGWKLLRRSRIRPVSTSFNGPSETAEPIR